MVNVAVLGYGTVGSGVVEIINGGQFLKKAGDEINVKAILDISGLKTQKHEVENKGINIVVADKEHKKMLEDL